jgi:predicted solute-binding protein
MAKLQPTTMVTWSEMHTICELSNIGIASSKRTCSTTVLSENVQMEDISKRILLTRVLTVWTQRAQNYVQ